MIRRVYGAHPAMAVRIIKPFLFVLILPLIKGVLQYIATGEATGVLTLEIFAAAALILSAVSGVRAFSVTVDGERLIIRRGLLFRSVSVIRRERLSSVTVRRGLLDVLTGAATYTVNTEAGVAGKTDFSFKVGIKHAEELSHFLYGGGCGGEIRFPAIKTALFAAATSSAVTGLLVGVPVVNNTARILGVAINRAFFGNINRVNVEFGNFLPPAVNILTGVIIIGYLASFATTFLKMLRLRIRENEEKTEVRHGFFVRRRVIFKKSAINDLCVEQTPIMRLFGVFSLRAAVGGYGDRRGEKAVIVPAANRENIERTLTDCFGFRKRDGIRAERSRRIARRALAPAVLLGALDVAFVTLLSFSFPDAFELAASVGAVIMAVNVYYASVCLRECRLGVLCLGEITVAVGRKGVGMREMYCKKDRIGEIKIIRTPADRLSGTCKVKLTVRSESADSVKVRFLGYADVIKEIEESKNK